MVFRGFLGAPGQVFLRGAFEVPTGFFEDSFGFLSDFSRLLQQGCCVLVLLCCCIASALFALLRFGFVSLCVYCGVVVFAVFVFCVAF